MLNRFALALVCLSAILLTRCSSSSGGSAAITITGKLSSASIRQALWDPGYLLADEERGALAGYQLYCVTFSSPTVSAKATAGTDGTVSVTLAASGVAFGCFVLDASNSQVATLTFKASSTTGSAVTFSSNTDLGTVQVNTQTGFAQVTLTDTQAANIVTKTPSTAACPTGIWSANLVSNACTSTFTGTFSITKGSDGTYHVGLTVPNGVVHHSPLTCQTIVFQNSTTVTYASNVLTFDIPDNDTGCPGKHATLAVTNAADCLTAKFRVTDHNCGSCDYSATLVEQCTGCGSTDCTASDGDASHPHDFTMTLQK